MMENATGMGGIVPTLELGNDHRGNNYNNGDGMMGGGWMWILLIFVLLGGRGGFGGFGNDGVAVSPATNLINNDFLYTQSKIDNLGQSILGQTTAINQTLCDGFGRTNTNIMQQGFQTQLGFQNLGMQLAQCCCDTNRNIDQVRFEAAQNTCDITTAIGNSTQAIKDLINANTMQDLRDDRERWRDAYDNAAQTSAINTYVTSAINQRFPYPVPASVIDYGYPGFGHTFPAPIAPIGGYPGHGCGGYGHGGCGNPF